jgi:hypothetical protein
MNDGTSETTIVEVQLLDGETIRARAEKTGAPDLDELHRTLQSSEFVRVGDDTLVRTADVRSLQLKEEGSSGGILDSLRARVTGDGDDSDDGDRRERPSYGREVRYDRGREVREVETRPFFLTSEFGLAFLAELGLLITTLTSDSVDARMFWLLTAALATVYALSRGFAKAGSPSHSFDPREEWLGGER